MLGAAMTAVATGILVLTVLVGVVMALEGAMKLGGVHDASGFERFGYPAWFHGVTGGLELLGGAAILAGVFLGEAVVAGGGIVVATVLAGAVVSHRRVGDTPAETAPAAILLVLAIVVVAGAGASL